MHRVLNDVCTIYRLPLIRTACRLLRCSVCICVIVRSDFVSVLLCIIKKEIVLSL